MSPERLVVPSPKSTLQVYSKIAQRSLLFKILAIRVAKPLPVRWNERREFRHGSRVNSIVLRLTTQKLQSTEKHTYCEGRMLKAKLDGGKCRSAIQIVHKLIQMSTAQPLPLPYNNNTDSRLSAECIHDQQHTGIFQMNKICSSSLNVFLVQMNQKA